MVKLQIADLSISENCGKLQIERYGRITDHASVMICNSTKIASVIRPHISRKISNIKKTYQISKKISNIKKNIKYQKNIKTRNSQYQICRYQILHRYQIF